MRFAQEEEDTTMIQRPWSREGSSSKKEEAEAAREVLGLKTLTF